MTLSTSPGQQNRPLFLWGGTYGVPVGTDGFLQQVGVNLIEEAPKAHESARDMADQSKLVLRPFVPGLGLPDIVKSLGSIRVRIPRAGASPAVMRGVHILQAWGGMVHICRFKEITEVFTYNGETGLRLLRRPFMMATHGLKSTLWPVNAATNYATVCTVNGTSATLTLGTPDDKYRVPFTTTPAYSAQGDLVIVHYVPLFFCTVVHGESDGKTTEPQNNFTEPEFIRYREVNGA